MLLPQLAAKSFLKYSEVTPLRRGLGLMGRVVSKVCEVPVLRVPHASGPLMRIRCEDAMSRSMLNRSVLGTSVWDALDALETGDVVLDVGANVGLFTLLASQRVGDHGLVFSSEPSRSCTSELLANLELNDATNVVVLSAAFAEDAGLAELVGRSDHSGVSHLESDRAESVGDEQNRTKETVLTIRGDTIASALKGKRLALVKIDVEGAELNVVRGMKSVLRQADRVVVEVTPTFLERFGNTAEELFQELGDLGFTAPVVDDKRWQYDVLFVRDTASVVPGATVSC